MVLAIDVHYTGERAVIAGVLFENWKSDSIINIYISRKEKVDKYVSGEFYKRELPCILALIEEHNIFPEIIVIDGYVYLDGHSKSGLGKYLYDSLDRKVSVIGVAKKAFSGISEKYKVFRGGSVKPLYVTSEGVNFEISKKYIEFMHGRYRIPTLLKKADQICRQKS